MRLARPDRSWAAPAIAAAAVAVWLGHWVIVVSDYGWDDGAITLAYARTFAESGRIALTPSSPVGEGYSSPAWFLLVSLVGLLGRPFGGLGYMGYIRAGHGLAVLSAAVGAALLTVLLRRWLGTPAAAVTAVIAFGGANMINEAMNGMEMLLLCAVIVALLIAIERNTLAARRWATGLAFAVPFIRLEALPYLALAGLFVLWWRRRMVFWMGASAALGLAVLTLTRLVVFGAWLPNTIAAKRREPYIPPDQWGKGPEPAPDGTPRSSAISRELLAAWTPIAQLLVIASAVMALALVLAVAHRHWSSDQPPSSAPVIASFKMPIWILAAFGWVVGCTATNWIVGRNWGYTTRMELSMIIAGVAAAAALGGVAIRALPWQTLRARSIHWALPFIFPLALLQVVSGQWALLLEQNNLDRARDGHEMGFVSPHGYAGTAAHVDRLRVMLGMDTLAYMVPDVGGTALCCPKLTILDSALLTNPTLTRMGWDQFGSYLASVSPDVIETHGVWSSLSGIYDDPYFTQNYRPIVIGKRFLWLRVDLLQRLKDGCSSKTLAQSKAFYRGDPVDEGYLAQQQYQVCWLA